MMMVVDILKKDISVTRISGKRTTYGYRRICALTSNSGIHVKIKTVKRIMRRNNLALPYAKHNNGTRRKDLAGLRT